MSGTSKSIKATKQRSPASFANTSHPPSVLPRCKRLILELLDEIEGVILHGLPDEHEDQKQAMAKLKLMFGAAPNLVSTLNVLAPLLIKIEQEEKNTPKKSTVQTLTDADLAAIKRYVNDCPMP